MADKPVRITDKMATYVAFARFCVTYKTHPTDLARMVTLARRAYQAGVRYANGAGRHEALDAAKVRFESVARSNGFTTHWPGLWPRLYAADGTGFSLPDTR